MIVTVTEYTTLQLDANKHALKVVGDPRERVNTHLNGAATINLQPGTRFVRVATDTAILIDPTGSGSPDMVPANTVDYLGVLGGSAMTVAIAT